MYVCGPVSGFEARNVVAFERAAGVLRRRGHVVFLPQDVVPASETDRERAMRHCIQTMLACDEVAVLPGWQRSAGAREEVRVARLCGIPVVDAPDPMMEGEEQR